MFNTLFLIYECKGREFFAVPQSHKNGISNTTIVVDGFVLQRRVNTFFANFWVLLDLQKTVNFAVEIQIL